MAVFLTQDTRAIVQGITGRVARVQTRWMLECGSPVVAGVTPGKGGDRVHGLPVHDVVAEAVEKYGANASVIFVPAARALAAAEEAVDAGLRLIVLISENVPILDAVRARERARAKGATLIGPNTPGLMSPGIGKLGLMPVSLFSLGPVGIVSRSGTLAYEVAGRLTEARLGQSTVIGIGGDPVVGLDLGEVLGAFEDDSQTEAVVIVGEIGGVQEEMAARVVAAMAKPVVAYVAGRTAPPGRRMGHAGAIIARDRGTVESKARALSEAGARVVSSPAEIVPALAAALR
ncbi:MAG: succinate--CoA ligase subunit alpha [Bacillota bacterium]|nr:succinate--CoA ligase subunit alpha [Bacillota bacterium]